MTRAAAQGLHLAGGGTKRVGKKKILNDDSTWNNLIGTLILEREQGRGQTGKVSYSFT